MNQPVPKHIKKGDTRGTEDTGKWAANTRPGGLLVGIAQSVASATGVVPEWTLEVPGEVKAA